MRRRRVLWPRVRQNGRLLHPILHRLGEVVFGQLQVVLRSNLLGVANPVTDQLQRTTW